METNWPDWKIARGSCSFSRKTNPWLQEGEEEERELRRKGRKERTSKLVSRKICINCMRVEKPLSTEFRHSGIVRACVLFLTVATTLVFLWEREREAANLLPRTKWQNRLLLQANNIEESGDHWGWLFPLCPPPLCRGRKEGEKGLLGLWELKKGFLGSTITNQPGEIQKWNYIMELLLIFQCFLRIKFVWMRMLEWAFIQIFSRKRL